MELYEREIFDKIATLVHQLEGLLVSADIAESTKRSLEKKNNWIGKISYKFSPAAQNIDNSIEAKPTTPSHISTQLNEEELMRLNKNTRKRDDGRYDWRKTIRGVNHYLINSDLLTLNKMVEEYKKNGYNKSGLKAEMKIIAESDKRTAVSLFDLCNDYYKRHIEGAIKSDKNYRSALKLNLCNLSKSIDEYSKDNIIDFLKQIKSKKQAKQCFYLLRYVFNDEYDKGNLHKDIFRNIKPPVVNSEKGLWFNPEEQKLIMDNIELCAVANEIKFFLMVGCRLEEAFFCTPEFEKNRVYINRTKRDGTSGYVKLSELYCKELKKNWSKMFKQHKNTYAEEFGKLLNHLGIKRQKNEKAIHRLRHTFATNIYYLGAKDVKIRSYLLGHKSSKITDDIYTDFDPNISRQDIKNIYGNLYPKFN